MKADEARKLTEKYLAEHNNDDIQEVLDAIKKEAEKGNTLISWYGELNHSQTKALMKLGYSTILNTNYWTISW